MSSKPDIAALETRRARGRPKAEDLAGLEARLVRVALKVFFAQGYGAASMSEIARVARVSKTTLYSRFPSKPHLFRAILDAQIRRAETGVAAGRRPGAGTLEARLRAYAEHMLRSSLSPEIVQLNRLIYSEAVRFPELGEAAWARSQVGVRHVAALIRQHAEEDGVPCRNPESVAEAYILMLRGWYQEALLRSREPGAAQVKRAVDGFLAILLAGRAGW